MNTETQQCSSPCRKFTSLALLCKRIIATNLERYPAESFCCLEESHWESIVQMKYRMTAPKIALVSGPTLSDGRRQPVIPYKTMLEIETKNPHLAKSQITDEVVWKDCTNFQFKVGGHSRPEVMILPWRQQVGDMKTIGSSLQSYLEEPDQIIRSSVHSNRRKEGGQGRASDDDALLIFRNLLQKHIYVLSGRPMSIPLLLQSEIGKVVKKFVKQCNKRLHSSSFRHGGGGVSAADDTKNDHDNLNDHDHQDDHDNDDQNDANHESAWEASLSAVNEINHDDNLQSPYKGKTFLAQFEILLNEWKEMASSSSNSTGGRNDRDTHQDQFLKDLEDVQTTQQWRELFQVLNSREKMIIKTRGAKMRKIREDIEVDRHKIKSTKVKKSAGNQKLGDRLLYGDKPTIGSSNWGSGGGSHHANAAAPVSKLNKLRQESVAGQKRINGVSVGSSSSKPSSFGSSVAAASTSASKKQSNSTNINKDSSAVRLLGAAASSSFGSSVAASCGKKRKVEKNSSSSLRDSKKQIKSQQRTFSLGDGKKLKLPSNMMERHKKRTF